MALEFICSSRIIEGKKIALPRESFNGKRIIYAVDRDKREIRFFYENKNGEDIFALNTWNAPKGARKMKFSIYNGYGQNILQSPVFYDDKEEILKIGNR